jgi:hypothetical protein
VNAKNHYRFKKSGVIQDASEIRLDVYGNENAIEAYANLDSKAPYKHAGAKTCFTIIGGVGKLLNIFIPCTLHQIINTPSRK